MASLKIRMYGCNLYLFSKLLIERLAKQWASMYKVEGRAAFGASLSNAMLATANSYTKCDILFKRRGKLGY